MTRPHLIRLIQALIDGRISEQDLALVQDELARSEDARNLYLDTVEIDTFLSQQTTEPALKDNVVSMEHVVQRQKRRVFKVAVMAAAALLILSLVTMRVFFIETTPPSGLTFEVAPGTQFEISHRSATGPANELTLEPGSRLQLSQGTVELNFDSGVKSIVSAPADITLHEPNSLYMNLGTAWFYVPQKAVGFKVTTKDLDIVDLGTKFGVIASPTQHDELHVLEGKVQVTANRLRKESAILTAGEARRIDPIGRLTNIPTKPKAFLTQLPQSLPYIRLAFNGTEQQQLEITGTIRTGRDLTATMEMKEGQVFPTRPGKFGNCLSSIGNGTIQTNWDGISGNKPRTVAYWVKLPKPESYYIHPLISWGGQNEQQFISTREFYTFVETVNDRSVSGLSLGAYWIKGTRDIADSQWHHIAYVYTGKSKADGDPEITCYIDGTIEATTRHAYSNVAKNDDGNIIVNTATEDFNASALWLFGHMWYRPYESISTTRQLDEIYIFQGALNEQDILKLYHHNQLN